MKRVYEGCIEAREISLTRGKGSAANPLAITLIKKSKNDSPEPSLETDAMATDAEIKKAALAYSTKMLSMNDVTKAHYLSLDAAAQEAFIEKSCEDMEAEAATSKKAKDEAAAAETAKAAGQSVKEADLEKRLSASEAKQAELEKALAARDAATEIEKSARDPKFSGFPGGEVEVTKRLTAIASLPEDVRKSLESDMAATAAMAKRAGTQFGQMTEDEIVRAAPAHAEVMKKAQAMVAADPSLTIDAAKGKVYADPANAALLDRALSEERQASH